MYSPTLSDDDADDDAVDDVNRNEHIGSFDVISGGHDTFVVASPAPEEDTEPAKTSKESTAERSRGSSEEASENVDHDSEIADRDDDDYDEDGSVYLTDYTISESLEEKDQEALALERSSGLAQSTRETFEYIDSDAASGPLTPVNEDLEMTLRIRDGGSPVARSTMIDDQHFTDEAEDDESVLLQRNNVEDQKQQDDGCSADVRDLSTNDSNGDKDDPVYEQGNFEVTADKQHRQVISESGVEVRFELGQGYFERDWFTNGSKGDEEVSPRDNDHLELTADSQQDLEVGSAINSDEESQLEQPEVVQDNVDDVDFGQTVSLEETSKALVASSNDEISTSPDLIEDHRESGSSKNPDAEDAVDPEQDFDRGNEYNSQQDIDLSSTDPDPFAAEPNQDQNGSVLGDTVTLMKMSEDDAPALSELERLELEQDKDDGVDVLGQTVSLVEASEALVASSSGDQTSTSPDITEDIASLRNTDDGVALDPEKATSSGKDSDEDWPQDEEYVLQEDTGISSTKPEPNRDQNGSVGHTVTLGEVLEDCTADESQLEQLELEQDNDDGGNVLGQTVSLEEASEALVAPSSGDQMSTGPDATEDAASLRNPDDGVALDPVKATSSGKDSDEDRPQDEEYASQGDTDLSSTKPEPNRDQNGSVGGHTITLGEVLEDCAAEESQLEQSELEQDNDDGADVLGQTVSLVEASEALVASSGGDQISTIPDVTEDFGSLINRDDEVAFDPEKVGKYSAEDRTHDEEHASKEDSDLSSTKPDPLIAEPNRDQNDGGSVLGHTVTLGDVSGDCTAVESQLEQLGLEQDNDDGSDVRGQTVSLEEASEALVSSSGQGCTSPDVAVDQQDSASRKNPDEEHPVYPENGTSSGKDSDKGLTHSEECSLQEDTDRFVRIPESNKDQQESDSFLGQTVTLKEVLEDGIPTPSGQTLANLCGAAGEKESVCENQTQNDGQTTQDDVQHPAIEPELDLPVSVSKDRQENIACNEDGGEDCTTEKGQNSQRDDKHPASDTVLPISASTNVQQGRAERTRNERQSVCQDPVNPYSDPDRSTPAPPTPDCLQLAVLSKPAVVEAERQLELVQSAAASNTWCEDEDKKNLLCLLDGRRRTEIDKNNWQLARHIEDNMSLVKDAELDDLENVQVSVKVSKLYYLDCFFGFR